MARVHAFEFEDQPWFPALIRRYMTDVLDFMAQLAPFAYEPFSDRLAAAMRRLGTTRIVDLCTGGGGPLAVIVPQLVTRGVDVQAAATDLFPNVEAMRRVEAATGGRARGVTTPVDATAVPEALDGVRVICNAFHHFAPAMAESILRDAVAKRRGIAVFEAVQRTPLGFAGLLGGGLVMLVATPFMKPFRLSRLLLTYVVPAVPLFVAWDGFVSCLRVYAPDEMRALIARADPEGAFEWTSERVGFGKGPATVTITVGVPRV